ncbi:hypothetical protein A6M14_02055 [Acinetobacter sp. Ac_877]|uniref:hypothetical protein n=1 Tax=Acinetobacter portensis TaxID=1839785 RepID=UPI00128DD94D|nr:hypothetical protein [Acinetobacter portensis]MPW42343.1 hypothetical protein [Acinetobacter portensis]
MYALILLILGFILGFFTRGLISKPTYQQKKRSYYRPLTHQQKLQLKSFHQTDSDRIRELNLLSTNESSFLRLLKQTFIDFDVAIKQKRFIILDKDKMPCAIFEYRDGTQAIKLVDKEDGIPLHLYKGLISSSELKIDYQNIISAYK